MYRTNQYSYEKTANGAGYLIHKREGGYKHQIKFVPHIWQAKAEVARLNHCC